MNKVLVNNIATQLRLVEYFSHFTIDQFSFEPKGYSLNAIKGECYFTLHITPEKLSSYVSFESNLSDTEINDFHQHLTTLLKPQRGYLMSFNPSKQNLLINTKTVINI